MASSKLNANANGRTSAFSINHMLDPKKATDDRFAGSGSMKTQHGVEMDGPE
jgi:hypothetical protein